MLKSLIDRPVTVSMITLVVVVLGLVSLRYLPVSILPDIDIPYITVQAESADLSAREIDQNVITPLRQQLAQIDGLEDILCEARDGSGTIKLTFSHGSDMDYLFIETNEKIDRAMTSLPDIQRPKVMKASATDIPAFYINVTGKEGTSFQYLSRFTKEVVCRRIEQLPAVAMADVSGTVSDEILIVPDEYKLQLSGMTMSDLEDCISSSNVRLGRLTIRDGEYRYNVRFDSKASSAQDIADMWFNKDGRLLQIKDVATVDVQPAKRTGLVRSDGKDAVCIAVVKQNEARMSDLRKAMDKLMDNFSADYPQMEFTMTRDQTRLLEYSIRNLLVNIVVALMLACIVIFLFMRDLRSPSLVALTMPVSLIFSMLCFRLVGLSLNIISLSGLLLGVGMMTDNTLVLVDNITGRWQRGESLRDAVLEGTREVTGPMLSSILTTCAVFIPLVFLNGMAGAMFKDEAISIAIVLFTSWLVTITVIPVYYWRWYKKDTSFRPNRILEKFSLDGRLQKWDDRWMEWSIRHSGLCWAVLAVSLAGMAGLFVILPKQRLPEMTETDTILRIDWNEHISVEQNAERIAVLEKSLEGKCTQETAFIGSQQFMLSHSKEQAVSEASIYIDCENASSLSRTKKETEELIHSSWPEATVSSESSGNIFDVAFADNEAPLTARLTPVSTHEVDMTTLRPLISSVRDANPEIEIPEPAVKADLVFVADPELMALYGVTYSQLISVLSNSMNENRLFSIAQGSSSIPVVTGSDAGSLAEIVEHTFVESHDDNGQIQRVPVSSMMRQTLAEDLRTVTSGSEGDYYPMDLEVKSHDVRKVMDSVRKTVREDGNYEAAFTGSWFSSRELVRQMIFILLIALALLYLILASQFESLVQPLIILSEIVIDIFASLAVLGICGVSVNLMSMIGLIVITGIVINDSILKIDTINRLRKAGETLKKAVMDASSRRMKAIIMTSLTTILAVCPFLVRGSMGADLQYPMSLVIIAGMTVGTFVSLFIVPAFYYSIYHGRKE